MPIYISTMKTNCQACGSTRFIHSHSIDGNPKNKNPKNRQRLCASCHQYIHKRGYVPKDKTLAKAEQIRKYAEIQAFKQSQKALRRNVPKGYMLAGSVGKKLGISRERLRQIRERLKYKIVGKSYAYLKSSVNKYKPKPIGRTPKYINSDSENNT
jgi:hypothetical protein